MEHLDGSDSWLCRSAQGRHQQCGQTRPPISWLTLLQAFHKHLPLERMASKKPLKWHLVRVVYACWPVIHLAHLLTCQVPWVPALHLQQSAQAALEGTTPRISQFCALEHVACGSMPRP